MCRDFLYGRQQQRRNTLKAKWKFCMQNAPTKQFIIYVENLNNPICYNNISGEDKSRIL